jgi:hypothetical protein
MAVLEVSQEASFEEGHIDDGYAKFLVVVGTTSAVDPERSVCPPLCQNCVHEALI